MKTQTEIVDEILKGCKIRKFKGGDGETIGYCGDGKYLCRFCEEKNQIAIALLEVQLYDLEIWKHNVFEWCGFDESHFNKCEEDVVRRFNDKIMITKYNLNRLRGEKYG